MNVIKVWGNSIMQMKGQCFIKAYMFINEIDQHFIDYKLMNAFGIMYLYFWMQLDVKLFFSLHFYL